MQEKDESVEILRVIAIWAVVLIHTTSASLAVSGFYHHNTPFSFFLNQAARFAVPLFFLISGYVLTLRYPVVKQLGTFYKKRFLKLALPFFIWSFIYYVFVAHASMQAFFVNSPTILLFGSAAEHLYFIPAIMFLYFLFPFINAIVQKFSIKRYFLAYTLFLLLNIFLLFIDYYSNELPIVTPLRIALLNLPIFIIGIMWAREKTLITNNFKQFWFPFSVFIFFASLILVVIEGHLLSMNGALLQYFMSQWRPSILLYTLSLFALSTYFLKKLHIIIPQRFSQVTFFIFFVHVIFIHVFWRLLGAYLFSKSMGHIVEQVWFDPLVFLFVIACSYASAFAVSKIPIVREILGER